MRQPARLLLLAILTLAVLLYSGARTAGARAAPPPDGPHSSAPQITATPLPTPLPDERDGPDNEEKNGGKTIWQTIIQTIVFPFEKLAEGVRNALAELFSRTVEAAMEPMKEALDMAVAWGSGFDAPGAHDHRGVSHAGGCHLHHWVRQRP